MLRITRTWNGVCAAAAMRHAHRLAADYAARRIAFGAPLAELPLHRETLADLEAECAGAFLLTFLLIEVLGRAESGLASEDDLLLLRVLTPLVKLTTGKQAVAAVSESIEAFGGAGYVEDTGLPAILRDTQVLPIWEGTTNVLALDLVLRADLERGLAPLERRLGVAAELARATGLGELADAVLGALGAAGRWLARVREPLDRQAGARRLALTLGRTTELALLAEHAGSLPVGPERAAASALARRLWRAGVNFVEGPPV
jgi:hypothetical protein